jgi:type IV secretion system protein VirB6
MEDPVGRLQVAYDQLGASAAAFGEAGDAAAQSQPRSPPAAQTGVQAAPLAGSDAEQAEVGRSASAAGRALSLAQTLVLTVHAGLVAASTLVVGVLGAVGPIFIVLFLFRQTRGFFTGWVRAMTAAALVSAATWTLILLMLRVIDPWLVTLAQQRELKALDPRTAMAAASIVEVFTAAQAGMVLLAAGVAFAFRLGSTPRAIATAQNMTPSDRESGRAPAELISRAGLLADQLRRFDPVFEARGRVAEARAGAARMAAASQVRSALLPPDSPYRRPAAAGGRRLRGRS